MSAAVCALVGVALLVVPTPSSARLRSLRPRAPGRGPRRPGRAEIVAAVVALLSLAGGFVVPALPLAACAWWGVRRLRARTRRSEPDPLRMAATGDLLAACLRSGLPVATSVRAVALTAQPDAAEALLATADLLALGAEPVEAWEPARRRPPTAELARAASRTARSGSALAGVAEDMARRARDTVSDTAESRAQRAGVLVAGPLGLCFLPAFLCLGIAPVVIGLADRLTF